MNVCMLSKHDKYYVVLWLEKDVGELAELFETALPY